MRRILAIAVAALMLCASGDNAQQKYISKYAPTAVSEMKRTGVPASITLAQGLVESNAGRSTLAVKGNNHFGIKCHSDWKGKTIRHDDDSRRECFRAYAKAEDSYRDHSDFLRYYDRYKALFALDPTDYKGWAHGLKAAGYATDPSYAAKLIKTIEDYALYRYDRGEDGVSAVEVPQTPEALEQVSRMDLNYSESYRFSLSRPVYTRNGVPFVYAMKGETYSSLARSNNLLLKEILSFNDLKSETPLAAGDVVYLQAKKKYAGKGLEKHIVGEDDGSLRDICQRFAVKMSSIRKLNSLPEDYVPREGDTIRLRK